MSISWCGNRFLSLLRVHICFTCVFLGYLRIDSWMLVCVCVYVCLHVLCHLSSAVEVRVKSALWFVQDFCPIVWGLLLMGFFFIEWGISIVKCNVTRPGLGREGGVTVTGLVTGLTFVLYKEKVPFTGPLFYVSFGPLMLTPFESSWQGRPLEHTCILRKCMDACVRVCVCVYTCTYLCVSLMW